MRSASRAALPGLAIVCALLWAGALSGCATTQETAARKQAQSKRILDARERRQEKRSKSDRKGGEQQ